jgi:glucose/arabinose dehydrogenase
MFACNNGQKTTTISDQPNDSLLPAPFATDSVRNYSKVVGWEDGKMPVAPAGFKVTKFADSLQNPRWIYVAHNGDVFVAEASTIKKVKQQAKDLISGKARSGNNEKSADRITLFRNGQRYTFLEGLNQPFGMLVLGDKFYVANTDGVKVFPYKTGSTQLTDTGELVLSLPAGGYNNHWTRNVITNADSTKLYVSVGSGSNAAEHGIDNEIRRANILQVNPDGTGEKIYASGLRNPVGMGWAPGTNTLWTAVNERDNLGDELVPDYLTSVQEGGFYGWPYSYFGQHEDPRLKGQRPDLVKQAIVPDMPLGAHTASLGLAFYTGGQFPSKYRGGAFIGQHGSWNRSTLSGYKVVFVPFKDGKPFGPMEDFLTGFMADSSQNEVHGRPVGVAEDREGALLVADDAGNTIWRVSKE